MRDEVKYALFVLAVACVATAVNLVGQYEGDLSAREAIEYQCLNFGKTEISKGVWAKCEVLK